MLMSWVPRRASRIVVMDGEQRVLLFQHARPEGGRFWATPGGGVEGDETFEQTARRELVEELGLSDVTLTPLWMRSAEQFFLLQVEALAVDPQLAAAHAAEGILQTRAWTLAELTSTPEVVYPEGLAQELSAWLQTRPGLR